MRDREAALVASIEEGPLVELCQKLVQFPTVNPPGHEQEIAEYSGGLLRDWGLAVELLPHGPRRASVVARLAGNGSAQPVVMNGHLDVVPLGTQPWPFAPFAGEVRDGRLWGRGTADMKAGVAAILAAAQALAAARDSLRGDLIVTLTAGEEGEQLGARAVAQHLAGQKAQALIIAEPSDNEVYIAEKGPLWLQISTHGQAAHGSAPHLGRNAILMMVRLLDDLQQLEFPCQEHPLLGKFTFSVNTIHGGVKPSMVPDRCQVVVDCRTVPGQDHADILRRVEKLIERLSHRVAGFEAMVEVIKDYPPLASAPDDPVVRAFLAAAADVTGRQPQPRGAAYFTDGVELAPALQAPLIICGPGREEMAHQPEEYVEVARLVESARILTLAAWRLLT